MSTRMAATIFIVDDNRSNIHILAELLREHKYRVRFARDGTQALSLLRKHHLPDLILLDIMMPDMDGFENSPNLRMAFAANVAFSELVNAEKA